MRLRYDNLQSTLGSSLSNSATSMTLSAPLEYANGTSVPTIASPDYLPMVFTDAGVFEIVYITAYTTGSTTATITRGEEGTAGIAHSSGDALFNSPTIEDFTPGGTATTPVITGVTSSYFSTNVPTFTIPSGAAVGEQLVAYVGSSYGVVTPPTGWTLITTALGSNHNSALMTRTCQSGDPGSTTGAVTMAGNHTGTIWCVSVSGVDNIADYRCAQSGGAGSLALGIALRAKPDDLVLEFGSVRGTGGTQSFNAGTVNSSRTGDPDSESTLWTLPADAFPFSPTYSNTAGGGGIAMGLIALSPVPYTVPAVYNDITFVSSTPPVKGQALVYDGTIWTPGPALATLKPNTLHATYGDDFKGASLDAKWTRVGYISGDEQYAKGADQSWLQIDAARGANNYYYQTPPAGDWTLQSGLVIYSGGTVLFSPLCALDSSGNGVGAVVDIGGSPPTYLTGTISGGSYGGSFTASTGQPGNVAGGGGYLHIKLVKSGTNYYTAGSLNGVIWSPLTAALSVATTITRVGFGLSIYSNVGSFAIDYFDLQ